MKQTHNIDMFGASMVLHMGHEQRYAVYRDLWFDEDFDGSWLVCAIRPEEPEVNGDRKGGGIRVDDPAVSAFLRELFMLLADPDRYGERAIPAPQVSTEREAAA
jgi:hypothetical protein